MEIINPTFINKIELGLNLINHTLITFVAIYMSYVCINLNLRDTALHAWLCTIGYNLLMAEGMMTLFSGNFITYRMQRKSKTMLHWILQAVGGTLGVIGSIIKIISKKTHFTTTHGIVGLIATILTVISMMTGLAALYNIKLKRWLTPLLNKTLHNTIGLSAFITGMIAIYYGYNTGFFRRKVEPDFADMMRGFTIISLILSCWGGLKALWDKIRNV